MDDVDVVLLVGVGDVVFEDGYFFFGDDGFGCVV